MQRKRFIQAGLGVVITGVMLLAQQSSASAASVAPNATPVLYFILGLPSQRCMNDPKNSTTPETQMIIYDCIFPNVTPNEEWVFQPLGSGNWWISNDLTGMCLTVYHASAADNAPIVQYPCNTGGNEEWKPVYKTTVDGLDYYNLTSVSHPTKCITVQNKATANGSKLLQYTCNGGDNQLWTWFQPSQIVIQ